MQYVDHARYAGIFTKGHHSLPPLVHHLNKIASHDSCDRQLENIFNRVSVTKFSFCGDIREIRNSALCFTAQIWTSH